ncbi:MAG TPA: zinc ribbon domain-containing protein, partial [Polyangiaceae bacterium]
MPACPTCGTANDTRAKRCSQCGAALINTPFEQAVPATRRMGHTMLGVSPLKPMSNEAEPTDDPDNRKALQPFAPVPGTLRGLNLQEAQDLENQKHSAEAAKPGLAAPPKTLPFGRSQTLSGFGAPPGGNASPAGLATTSQNRQSTLGDVMGEPAAAGTDSSSSATSLATPTSDVPELAAPTASPLSKTPDTTNIAKGSPVPRPKASVHHHATIVGIAPAQTGPSSPGDVKRPAAGPLNATLVGFAAIADTRGTPAPSEAAMPLTANAIDGTHSPPKRQTAPFKGTLMGVSPVVDQRQKLEDPPKASFKGTLLGVAPFGESMPGPTEESGTQRPSQYTGKPESPAQQRVEAPRNAHSVSGGAP